MSRDYVIYSGDIKESVEGLPFGWSPTPRKHPSLDIWLLDKNDSTPFTQDERIELLVMGAQVVSEADVYAVIDAGGWNA